MDIVKCTKIHNEGFGLTIFMNTTLDYSKLTRHLRWVKDHIGDRELMLILFGGEPMVPEFGEHHLPDNLGSIFLTLSSIFKDNLNIDIYSDLLVPKDKLKTILDCLSPFQIRFSWRFTPEFYSPNSMNNFDLFKENFKLIQDMGCMGETSFIITESSYMMDKYLYENLKDLFPKSPILMTPKQGEESSFFYKVIGTYDGSKATHEISFKELKTIKVCYPEILEKGFNKFKDFQCDTKNHAVMDLSGNLYSCLTAYSQKNFLFTEGDKEEFMAKLQYTICSYNSCNYDDNMSVFI